MHKTVGGGGAGVLFVLPSVFLLIGLSWIHLAWGNLPAVGGILYGIKSAVIAIVLFAAWRIGTRALKNAALWAIAAAASIAIFVFKLPFPYIVLGAGVVVTYFTFLPSFIMIFLGGPLIETTHANLKFTAPLTGITAAVVGVILNLAVFFAYQVLWPHGFGSAPDWMSATICLGAGVALWRYKIGIIPVIAACSVAGLAITLIRSLDGLNLLAPLPFLPSLSRTRNSRRRASTLDCTK